jgi:hypothetical protein
MMESQFFFYIQVYAKECRKVPQARAVPWARTPAGGPLRTPMNLRGRGSLLARQDSEETRRFRGDKPAGLTARGLSSEPDGP